MPKILVADDNSNIQKMVGLALKDQGIDVVAVGNGEAAVRKISDVRPDLVLADVFMPVRNGYEVCQYVKADTELAHIPVILLVGAFDPLDEQEAQRVGADGVLKKPFVPPDPLISMVKSALARAGVSVGAAPKEEPVRVAEMIAPRAPQTMPAPVPPPEFPALDSEPLQEPLVAATHQPEPVRIEAGSQPLAFGSLLDTTSTEEEVDEGLATTARPQLEHDWGASESEEEEVEEAEEDESSASWRRDAGDEAVEAASEPSDREADWRETAFADAPARKSSRESWTPQKEVSGFEEAAEVEEHANAFVPEAPAVETKANPAPVAPFSTDAWSAGIFSKTTATVEAEVPEPEKPAASEVRAEVSAPKETIPAPETPKPASESSWYSAVSSPWEAEAQKASKLAATWDDAAANAHAEAPAVSESAPAAEPEAKHEDPAATVDALPPALSEDVKAKVEKAALPTAAVEEILQETHYVAESALEQEQATQPEAKPAELKTEDLVARVLAQMSPEVLQAVTREILKPVVEAMVKDELSARKK